jgi:hypothetical protein
VGHCVTCTTQTLWTFSCSDAESHASLSREPSDSASLAIDLHPRLFLSATPSTGSSEASFVSSVDEKLLEFATKLGYTEDNLRYVLQHVGQDAEQDQVLCALVKLGRRNHTYATRGHIERNRVSPISEPKLRSIVIDGSNLAMTHGHKEVFSCRGIRECVNFFVARNHTDIIVFVPQFRRESPRSDSPIHDQVILTVDSHLL